MNAQQIKYTWAHQFQTIESKGKGKIVKQARGKNTPTEKQI